MKGFAFVLLCALVAVQGRHTGVQQTSTSSVAVLGENPWVVHLRIAVATSGLLNSCTGSLIDGRWVLTTASCLTDSRFIWVRYGTVNVINPKLVTENSLTHTHPSYNPVTAVNNIALININRNIETTAYIAPIGLSITPIESSNEARVCGYGKDDLGRPGEQLICNTVIVTPAEDGTIEVTSEDNSVVATSFDIGASLVIDGVQVAVLTAVAPEDCDYIVGKFTPIAGYLDWIGSETGIVFWPEAVPAVAPEAVSFVN